MGARDAVVSRARGASPSPTATVRTPFQRDRDRIVHAKAFRRLKHKTQVFIAPEGDHYRTRLTHTLETCGIARTVARALGLNEDLTEAIGLRPRPRAPAVRPHRRGGARRGAARARRPRLQAQPALPARRRRARARRARAQPDRAGARRDPPPHGPRAAGDAGGAGRAPGGPGRLHQPRHRRRDARGDPRCRPTCPRTRSSCWGRPARRGSTRWCATSSSTSREAGDIAQSEEVGGAMLRLRKFMFDRVYLGAEARVGARSGPPHAARPVRALPRRTPSDVPEERAPGADECSAITDWHRGDDRPVLHRDLPAAGAAGGVAAVGGARRG